MAVEARDTPTIGNPVQGGPWTADAAFWHAAERILDAEPAWARRPLVQALGRFGWRKGTGAQAAYWSPEAPYGIRLVRAAFEDLPRGEQVELMYRVLRQWLEWVKTHG